MALPRDGDGDGLIYEGTPRERPAAPRTAVRANLTTTYAERGEYGNRTHITMEERGTIPTAAIANLPGKSGEIPGEHRNRKGEAWDAFLADIAANGITNGIFIVVEPDGVSIYEGNHRRDAAVELGLPEVPVQIRYFGAMEKDGTFMERYERGELPGVPAASISALDPRLGWASEIALRERHRLISPQGKPVEQVWAERIADNPRWASGSQFREFVDTFDNQQVIDDAFRAWRSSFADSLAYRSIALGEIPAPAFQDESSAARAEIIKRAVDEGAPIGRTTYRSEPLTAVPKPGDRVELRYRSVAAAKRDALEYERTFLVPYGDGPDTLLYVLPPETSGYQFPDGREAVVSGDFVVDRVETDTTRTPALTQVHLSLAAPEPEPDYRGQHQPPDDGPTISEMGETDLVPGDFIEHVNYYTGFNDYVDEVRGLLERVQGNPDAPVRVYRAVPPGVTDINPGDWVTPIKRYAKDHAIQDDDPDNDWPVISAVVPASTVRFGGDDAMEWGYFGAKLDATAPPTPDEPTLPSPTPNEIIDEGYEWGDLPQGAEANVRLYQSGGGDESFRAVLKTFKPTSYSSDTAESADRELFANRVAKAIGAPVPDMERHSEASVAMSMINPIDDVDLIGSEWGTEDLADYDGENTPVRLKSLLDSAAGRKIGLLDFLIGNNDRHSGNVIARDDGSETGDPVAIDHGMAFKAGGGTGGPHLDANFSPSIKLWIKTIKGPSVGWRQSLEGVERHDYTAEELARVRSNLEALERLFIDADHESWYDGMMDRLAMLERATGHTKALPRDADGDGIIYEGTPRERPAVVLGPAAIARSAKEMEHVYTGGEGRVYVQWGDSGAVITKDYVDSPRSAAHEVWATKIAAIIGAPVARAERDWRPAVVHMDFIGTMEDGVPVPAPTLAEVINPNADWLSYGEEMRRAGEWFGTEEGRLLGLLDFVIYNRDRHEGNLLIQDGSLVGIDHGGLTFDPGMRLGGSGLVGHWVQFEPGLLEEDGTQHPNTGRVLSHPWTAEEIANIDDRLHEVGLPEDVESQVRLRLAQLSDTLDEEAKALPRDGDGDGFIWDGTPRETLRAPLAAIYEAADSYRRLPQGMTSDIWVRSGPLGDVVVKTFKPNQATGSNPKLDCDREWLAYQVAEALEAPVPRMERRSDITVLMDFVETDPAARMSMREVAENPEGRKIALLDLVVANPDRHVGNILLDLDGDPVAVDQGLAFQFKAQAQGPARYAFPAVEPRGLQNPARQRKLKPHDLSAEEVADVRRRIEVLEPQFSEHPDWYRGMMKRVDMLEEATTKALPRDAGGDGLIYEGTVMERPAPGRVVSAGQFRDAFESAFAGSPYTHHVTHRSLAEMEGLTPIMAPSGQAGVLVEDHGDGRIEATALFNASGESGVGLELLQLAIDRFNVNYVECYGPVLNRLYERLGFRVDTEDPFAEEYAAPGWDYEAFNHPHYFTMSLPGEKAVPTAIFNDIFEEVAASGDPRADNQIAAALVLLGEAPPNLPLPGLDEAKALAWDPLDHPRDRRGRFSVVSQAVRAIVDTVEDGSGTKAHDLYGAGFDALFPDERPTTVVPWRTMGRRKDLKDYDPDIVRRALMAPPELRLIDPRGLRATQPNITRAGVDFYLNDDDYWLYGKTYEAGSNVGNKYPFIYLREDGQALILSGHHRATAALLKGEPLEAIIISGPWGPPRRP